VDVILKSADWVEWYPRTPKWVEIRDKLITPQVDLIVRGKVGVAEGLKKLNDDANGLLNS
jgi:hypothetical protein